LAPVFQLCRHASTELEGAVPPKTFSSGKLGYAILSDYTAEMFSCFSFRFLAQARRLACPLFLRIPCHFSYDSLPAFIHFQPTRKPRRAVLPQGDKRTSIDACAGLCYKRVPKQRHTTNGIS
jgi:hypothetical protein